MSVVAGLPRLPLLAAVALFASPLLYSRGDAQEVSGLLGKKLRCCYLLEEPFIVPDPTASESSNISGLAITYLSLLERRLGFSCSLRPYKEVASKYKGFSGFVRRFADCGNEFGESSDCECDIGIGAWAVSSERFRQVDYVASYSSEAFQAVTRTEAVRDSAVKHVFFMQAFSGPVWLAIAGLVALHALVTLFDDGFAPLQEKPDISRMNPTFWQRHRHVLLKQAQLRRIRLGALNSVVHFVGQYVNDLDHKLGTKTKLMNILGLLMGVFLLTLFQASITVQVLITTPVSEFGSIQDVKSCRIGVDKLCFAGNGAAENFFKVAVEPSACVAKDLASGAVGRPHIVGSFEEGFESVLKGDYDYYYTLRGQILSQSRGRYCGKLTAVGQAFWETSVGFILPKNSSFTQPLSLETLLLQEQDKLVSSKVAAEREICQDITDATLNWDKLKVFFYVSYAGLALMLLLMVFDRSANVPTASLERIESQTRHGNGDGDGKHMCQAPSSGSETPRSNSQDVGHFSC